MLLCLGTVEPKAGQPNFLQLILLYRSLQYPQISADSTDIILWIEGLWHILTCFDDCKCKSLIKLGCVEEKQVVKEADASLVTLVQPLSFLLLSRRETHALQHCRVLAIEMTSVKRQYLSSLVILDVEHDITNVHSTTRLYFLILILLDDFWMARSKTSFGERGKLRPDPHTVCVAKNALIWFRKIMGIQTEVRI